MPDRPPARLWTIFARVDLGLLPKLSLWSLSVSLSGVCVSLCVCTVSLSTQAPNSLWYLSDQTAIPLYRQLLLSQLPPDQSTLLYSPPRHKCGKALARTPFYPSSKTRSRSHIVVWEDTYKSMETLSPALSFWVSRSPWKKQHNTFRKLLLRLQTLNAEGLNVQTVKDLLTMYVGAASQHVLRMSFVPEQEAQNFDRQAITYWSRLMHRDIASPLFFLHLKLGGLDFLVQHHYNVANSLNSNPPSPNR